jgi:hypothetical protein
VEFFINFENSIPRAFEADYLEKDSNPHKLKYLNAMKKLFSTFGDEQIMFADYVNKINPRGKTQKRAIIVTEKNIYKQDPKTDSVKKVATPIAAVTAIALSKSGDTFMVLQCKHPYRDMVIDLGVGISSEPGPVTDGGILRREKYSEFATVLIQERKKLTGETIPVLFDEKIPFNNARTQKKTTQDALLEFELSLDQKITGSTFKKVNNAQYVVSFPSSREFGM